MTLDDDIKIYNNTGTEEVPVMTEVPGFHVNITAADLEEFPEVAAWRVQPQSLRRVWAGDDPENPTYTVALQFADRAEYEEVMLEVAGIEPPAEEELPVE